MAWKCARQWPDGGLKEEICTGCKCIILPHELTHGEIDNMVQNKERKWGPHSVDMFAHRLNHLLPQFVTWKRDPMAMATDAMTLSWTNWGRIPLPSMEPSSADCHQDPSGTSQRD